MKRGAVWLWDFGLPWMIGLLMISIGIGLASRDLGDRSVYRSGFSNPEVGLDVAFVMLFAGTAFVVAGVVGGILRRSHPRLAPVIVVAVSTIVALATVATHFWSADRACETSVGGQCWPVGTAPVAAAVSVFVAWALGFAAFALVVRKRDRNPLPAAMVEVER